MHGVYISKTLSHRFSLGYHVKKKLVNDRDKNPCLLQICFYCSRMDQLNKWNITTISNLPIRRLRQGETTEWWLSVICMITAETTFSQPTFTAAHIQPPLDPQLFSCSMPSFPQTSPLSSMLPNQQLRFYQKDSRL